MGNLFNSGIRPTIDAYIDKLAEEERNYGDYWSASSAGFCMRLNILRRLKVPPVPEIQEAKARQQRVFSAGHVFHEWIQRITKETGLSIAQEIELQDEDLMIRGHIDDLVLVDLSEFAENIPTKMGKISGKILDQRLILYDYKTVNSQAFKFKKDKIGHYHRNQLGTYMYMLRKQGVGVLGKLDKEKGDLDWSKGSSLTEARRLSMSKDDLRMAEVQLFWDEGLAKEVTSYWKTLNKYWKDKVLPKCTCLEHDGGFMGKRSAKGKVYNDYFYEDEPCSLEWAKQHKELLKGWSVAR